MIRRCKFLIYFLSFDFSFVYILSSNYFILEFNCSVFVSITLFSFQFWTKILFSSCFNCWSFDLPSSFILSVVFGCYSSCFLRNSLSLTFVIFLWPCYNTCWNTVIMNQCYLFKDRFMLDNFNYVRIRI